MECCEVCGLFKIDTRTRWYEAREGARWERPVFHDCDICDECNAARAVPMIDEKPSMGGTLTRRERSILREWGELPEYWWRQPWSC